MIPVKIIPTINAENLVFVNVSRIPRILVAGDLLKTITHQFHSVKEHAESGNYIQYRCRILCTHLLTSLSVQSPRSWILFLTCTRYYTIYHFSLNYVKRFLQKIQADFTFFTYFLHSVHFNLRPPLKYDTIRCIRTFQEESICCQFIWINDPANHYIIRSTNRFANRS